MIDDRYLFRGFHKDENGKETIYIEGQAIKGYWLYGGYHKHREINYCFKEEEPKDNIKHLIVADRQADWNMRNGIDVGEVIPETIGQYIGLNDKNGKKIFENDYLKFKVFEKDSKGYVSYYTGQFYIVDCGGYSDYNFLIYTDMEVIGTIFDEKEVK